MHSDSGAQSAPAVIAQAGKGDPTTAQLCLAHVAAEITALAFACAYIGRSEAARLLNAAAEALHEQSPSPHRGALPRAAKGS